MHDDSLVSTLGDALQRLWSNFKKRVQVEKLDNPEMIVFVIMQDKWYKDDKHADGVLCYSSILSNDANYIQQKSVYLIHWKTFYRY